MKCCREICRVPRRRKERGGMQTLIKEKIKKKKKRYERDKFYRDFVNLLIIKRKVEQNVDYL